MKIKFYGHAGVKIEDDLVLLIDPWLNDNPLATMKADDITKADYIIATHNHFDHVNDIPLIAKNTNLTTSKNLVRSQTSLTKRVYINV